MADLAISTSAPHVPNNLTADRAVASRLGQAMTRLDASDRQTVDVLLRSELGKEQRFHLDRITSTAGFRGASTEGLTAILHHLAVQHRAGTAGGDLYWVLKEPSFSVLGGKEQSQIVALLGAQPPNQMVGEALGQLLQRKLPDGTPALLSLDSRGSRMLDRLTALASMTIHPDITAARMPRGWTVSPSNTLLAVIQECAMPAVQIDQGSYGACAAASMQDILCKTQPAEYARIVLGLFTAKEVSLTGGGSLRLVPDSIVPRPDPGYGALDTRSHPERIVQSALLGYTDALFRYSYRSDSKGLSTAGLPVVGSVTKHLSLLPGGMYNHQVERGMEGLFGQKFYTVEGSGQDVHAVIRSAHGPVIVGMEWSGGKHALVYCGTRDGSVYLKDPNGGPGGTVSGPPRTATSLHGANVRMTPADFEAHLLSGTLPGGSPRAGLTDLFKLILPEPPTRPK